MQLQNKDKEEAEKLEDSSEKAMTKVPSEDAGGEEKGDDQMVAKRKEG